jgi:hypothetical protein
MAVIVMRRSMKTFEVLNDRARRAPVKGTANRGASHGWNRRGSRLKKKMALRAWM